MSVQHACYDIPVSRLRTSGRLRLTDDAGTENARVKDGHDELKREIQTPRRTIRRRGITLAIARVVSPSAMRTSMASLPGTPRLLLSM